MNKFGRAAIHYCHRCAFATRKLTRRGANSANKTATHSTQVPQILRLLFGARQDLSGTASDAPYGFKFSVDDGSGEVLIFANAQRGISMSGLVLGQSMNVTGFSSQYDTHYEIDPRGPDDIAAQADPAVAREKSAACPCPPRILPASGNLIPPRPACRLARQASARPRSPPCSRGRPRSLPGGKCRRRHRLPRIRRARSSRSRKALSRCNHSV
jgi:hypothetical protein